MQDDGSRRGFDSHSISIGQMCLRGKENQSSCIY